MSLNDSINSIKETLLKSYPIPITIESTKKILNQMQNCICKINNSNGKGTGFFCYISNPDNPNEKKMPVLITNNHVINKKIITENKSIKLTLDEDDKVKINIDLNVKRKIYTSDEKIYDTTIIEIKPEDKLNEKNFLELDIKIFDDDIDINEDIYYPISKIFF